MSSTQLTGLRGMAAMMVVIIMFPTKSLWFLSHATLGWSYTALVVFYMLSGFLMGMIYFGREPVWSAMLTYAAARIGRVAPLYLSNLLVWALSDACGALKLHLPSHMDHFFLVECQPGAWSLLLITNPHCFHYMSIAIEIQFYILFCVVWRMQDMELSWIIYAATMLAFRSFLPAFHTHGWPALHVFLIGVSLGRRFETEAREQEDMTAHRAIGTVALLYMLMSNTAKLLVISPHKEAPVKFADPAFIDNGYVNPIKLSQAQMVQMTFFDPLLLLSVSKIIELAALGSPITNIFASRILVRTGRCSFGLFLLTPPAFLFAGGLVDKFDKLWILPEVATYLLAIAVAFTLAWASATKYEPFFAALIIRGLTAREHNLKLV